MNRSDLNWPTRPSGWTPSDADLDAFAEGTLRGAKRDAVAAWLDAELQIEEASPVAAVLRERPSPSLPPDISRNVIDAARRDARRARRRWLAEALSAPSRWMRAHARPALAGASLVALVATAGILGRSAAPPSQQQADVAAALADVQVAFGYFDAVSQRASVAVRQDVEAHVVTPLGEALGGSTSPRIQ